MFRSPTSPESSIQRLIDEGYDTVLVDGLLVVRNVPYVAPGGGVRVGTLAVLTSIMGDRIVAPRHHAALWAGAAPCDANSRPLTNLIASTARQLILPGIWTDYSLCNKPHDREFVDYHEYVTTYVALLGVHAAAVDPRPTARVYPAAGPASSSSPFRYADTATARAGIGGAARRITGQTIGIIGLGGTGSYLLDLVAKCPVRAIHLFDADAFQQHNAFRCPGAFALEDLRAEMSKVQHLSKIYSRMHRRVIPHEMRIDTASASMLDVLDFAFVCVDDGPSRGQILALLAERGTNCVDVGMGLSTTNDAIAGAVRTTLVRPDTHEAAFSWVPTEGHVGDVYGSNVQVAELNAINAAFAVIAWKRHSGFYASASDADHSVYVVETGALHRETM